MISFLFDLLTDWAERRWRRNLSKDYRDDPVYRENLERLIKQSQQFEKAEK